MKAVIQRVSRAEVVVGDETVSSIQGSGILTLLGVMKGDDLERAKKIIRKICDLRIFEDDSGRMNRSLVDVGGSHLIVSQFTLAADTSSGRRPSFTEAEQPERARVLYEQAIEFSREFGVNTAGGVFQADMKVMLINDGPVTIILES